MDEGGPIAMMIVSIMILILTVFFLFYYEPSPAAIAFFSIGITLGLVACGWLIYNRTPDYNFA